MNTSFATKLAAVLVLAGAISGDALGQPVRWVALVAADGTRVKVTENSPTLPASIDALSIRVFIDGGPVSLCEKQNFGNTCMKILNKKIFCDLDNCFSGAGDWRNRIRSVRFD